MAAESGWKASRVRGASFSSACRWPLIFASAADRSAAPAQAAAGACSGGGGGGWTGTGDLSWSDDDAAIRNLLRQELEAGGFRVSEAADGLEGVARAKELQPDLVLLDVMMPQLNGFDAAAILKNDPQTSEIPIIMLTIIEDAERGYRLGVDRYLRKPVDIGRLLGEIGSLRPRGVRRKK